MCQYSCKCMPCVSILANVSYHVSVFLQMYVMCQYSCKGIMPCVSILAKVSCHVSVFLQMYVMCQYSCVSILANVRVEMASYHFGELGGDGPNAEDLKPCRVEPQGLRDDGSSHSFKSPDVCARPLLGQEVAPHFEEVRSHAPEQPAGDVVRHAYNAALARLEVDAGKIVVLLPPPT